MQVDLRRENDWLQPEVPEGLASSQQAFFPPPLLCPWSGSGVRDCPLIEAPPGEVSEPWSAILPLWGVSGDIVTPAECQDPQVLESCKTLAKRCVLTPIPEALTGGTHGGQQSNSFSA